MKNIAFAVTIFIAVLLTGCSVDRGVSIEPEQAPPLPASVKGYELYSWYAEPEDEGYYTLIIATNRLKTYEEITSAENKADEAGWVKITVKGVDSLKALLERLPEGETVVWIEEPGSAHTSGENQNFAFPEQTVVEAIEKHARSLGLEFYLAGRAGRDLSLLTASPIITSLISTASTPTFITTLTPTPISLPPPIPLKTGPMVDIPDSNYRRLGKKCLLR